MRLAKIDDKYLNPNNIQAVELSTTKVSVTPEGSTRTFEKDIPTVLIQMMGEYQIVLEIKDSTLETAKAVFATVVEEINLALAANAIDQIAR
jgi:hypothetical protein